MQRAAVAIQRQNTVAVLRTSQFDCYVKQPFNTMVYYFMQNIYLHLAVQKKKQTKHENI